MRKPPFLLRALPRFFNHFLAGSLVLAFSYIAAQAQPVGTITGWGNNGDLQLQPPGGLTGVIALAAGNAHSLALKNDGTVAAWGFNFYGQATAPFGLNGVTAIGAGVSYSMALRTNSSVVVWGDPSASPSSPITNAIAIAAGWTHALALQPDGTVIAWGMQTNVPANVSNVIAIAA